MRYAPGNRKTGSAEGFYTYSRLPVLTCETTPWCESHCYAIRLLSYRAEAAQAWAKNSHNRVPEVPFDARLLRLHVAGDFGGSHDVAGGLQYIRGWHKQLTEATALVVWGYTRSWRVPVLRAALEELRALHAPRVQLFASLDPGETEGPEGWRWAHVGTGSGLACPNETTGQSCLECGYCFRTKRGDVVFHEKPGSSAHARLLPMLKEKRAGQVPASP